jgi:hypothetical protein
LFFTRIIVYFEWQWVAKQREQYKLLKKGKHSFLTPDRLEKLNAVGFVWTVRGETAEDDVTGIPSGAVKEETKDDEAKDGDETAKDDDKKGESKEEAKETKEETKEEIRDGVKKAAEETETVSV